MRTSEYITNTSLNEKKLFVIFIMTIILFIRFPSAFIYPQLFAEDGTIYFAQNWNYGLGCLFTPYSGYLVVIHRLIAYLIGLFPLRFTPALYNYAAFLILIFIALKIFSSRIHIQYKPFFVLSLVLVPTYGEVYMTINDAMTILSLLLLLLIIQKPPTKYWEAIGDGLILVFTGITGPFIIFAAPLFLVKSIIIRSRYNLVMLLMTVLILLIQGYFIITKPESMPGMNVLYVKDILAHSSKWIHILGTRIFEEMFLGKGELHFSKLSFSFGILTLLLPLFIYFVLKDNKRYLAYAFCFLFFGFVIALASFTRYLPNQMQGSIPLGDRYFFIIHVMIMWCLVLCFSTPKFMGYFAIGIYLFIIVFSTLPHFKTIPSLYATDYQWQKYQKILQREHHAHIPINPRGWYIDI